MVHFSQTLTRSLAPKQSKTMSGFEDGGIGLSSKTNSLRSRLLEGTESYATEDEFEALDHAGEEEIDYELISSSEPEPEYNRGAVGTGASKSALSRTISDMLEEILRVVVHMHIPGKTVQEDVAVNLRQLRGSFLTTFLPLHVLISLRELLWKREAFVAMFILFWVWLLWLLIVSVSVSGAECFASVIPLFGNHSCLFANMTRDTPYTTTWAFEDWCVDSHGTQTVVPVCGMTERSVGSVRQGIEVAANTLWYQFAAGLLLSGTTFFMYKYRGNFLAKKPRTVLRAMVKGLRRGTFMVSYSWTGETLLAARSVANLFLEGRCWVDVQNILPGASIEDICTTAAAKADVGFVFITPEYLASRNCCLELINFEPACAPLIAPRMGLIDDFADTGHWRNSAAFQRPQAGTNDDDDGDGDGDGDGAPRERGVELWSTSPSSSRGCSLSTPRWAGDRWARELEWVFASTGGWPWRPRCLGCC